MLQNNPILKISQAIDFIERNIHNKIALDDIAAYTNLSKYHLHRIFKALTNQKMMDYVRNRKLSQSINELINTDLNLIDIAYEYSFAYEQSYIRSFIRLFNISPKTFRTEKTPLQIVDKLNVNYIQPIGETGIVIKPTIIIKPAFAVVGIEHKLFFNDEHLYSKVNQYANDFFYKQRHRVKHAKFPDTYIGIVKYIENVTAYKYYITSVEAAKAAAPSGMQSFAIPTHKYASFKYIGFHHVKNTTMDNLYDTYSYIFNEWLPKSGYIFTGLYHIESIDNEKNRDDYCEINLLIPIKTKNGS